MSADWIHAKYEGWCCVCKQRIRKGDPISRLKTRRGWRWVHLECHPAEGKIDLEEWYRKEIQETYTWAPDWDE